MDLRREGHVGAQLLFVVAAALSITIPAVADAQCVVFEKPEDLFARADAVFMGTVVATKPTGAKGSHAIVDIATLRVEQTWKGDFAREIRVGSDRALEHQKKYLVFAAGTPLTTSVLCRWAEREDHAKTKLEWLAQHQRVLITGEAVDVAACEREAERWVGKKAVRVGGRVRPPKKIRNVSPDYPALPVGTRALAGTPLVGTVLIDTNGRVSRVWTVRGVQFRPPFPHFNEAIVAAVHRWEFEPAQLDGRAVPVCMAVSTIVDWQ
jgi:hypothetical protein